MSDSVILVNEQDEAIGFMEKMEAHQRGLLHRAFSVFIFNTRGEILLQQRARSKYHSGGLWTNTCCSHPRANETIEEAGARRLQEEMGIACRVERVFQFIYRAELDSGLIENELDYVLFGNYNESFTPNPEEVMNTRWISPEDLIRDCTSNPENYTAWLQIILTEHLDTFKRALHHENNSR